jgi:mono/diheme cytochrome c family protein
MKQSVLAFTIFACLLASGAIIQGKELATNASGGEIIYRVHCLRCHGKMGDGKGPDSANLMVPPRDFHAPESTGKTELELRSIIIWGLVFSPMHGWWDRLSSEEIRAVISYIRQLAPYQPRI